MEKRGGKPQSIGDVIAVFLRQYKLEGFKKEQDIFKVWAEVLGEPLAGKTRPLRIDNGFLTVLVADSAWMQELQFHKAEIKKKLNRALSGQVIKDIRFKVGEVGEETP